MAVMLRPTGAPTGFTAKSTTLLDIWAKRNGAENFAALSSEDQGALKERLKDELRTNRYDPATGAITVSPDRAAAIAAVGNHYAQLFSSEPDARGTS